MKNVMTRAWEIAREAVKNFGGKVKEFFAQSLALAWGEVKMNNEIKCFLPQANVEVEVNLVTGVVTGDTYKAKEVLKKRFNAKWDSNIKSWVLDTKKGMYGCMSQCESFIDSFKA